MSGYLILGGGGFIGAHLARALLDQGLDVTVADDWRTYGAPKAREVRAWRRAELLDGARLVGLNTDDPGEFSALLSSVAPQVVVHLANLPLPAVAHHDPVLARRDIVGATGAVLDALRQGPGDPRLVYVSSSMVYGDFTSEPISEGAPCKPIESYGLMKLQAEHVARRWPNTTVVRPSAVYGPGDVNGRFIQRLVSAARRSVPLRLTGSLETRLDFTWVGDLTTGLRLACDHPQAVGETFNMTRGEARSLGEAVDIVRDLGYPVELVRDGAANDFRPRRGALDIGHAANTLGYKPTYSLEAGLARYVGVAERFAGAMI